jgi:lipopolysaccharide transport system ATP-binding protein
VAINVDPDILIVDEALAVGDDLFQRKCFAKIEEFRSRNKTIVFVTHSSSTVVELCNRAILLDSGEQLIVDKSQRVVNLYHKLLFASEEKRDKIKEQIVVYTKKEEGVGSDSDLESVDPKSGVSDEEALFQRDFFDESLVPKDSLSYELVGARIFDYVLVNSDGEKVNVIQFGHKYLWRYKVEFLEHCANARFGMMIKTNKGLELCGAATHKIGAGIKDVVRGEILQVEFSFMPRFVGGVYYLSCGVLGNTNGEEVFMHRFVEVWPFRLQDQSNSLLSGIVDMNLKSIIKKIKEAE